MPNVRKGSDLPVTRKEDPSRQKEEANLQARMGKKPLIEEGSLALDRS